MKKQIAIIIPLLLLFSCYSDKGNYKYKDIERVEITFPSHYVNTIFGNVVEIEPELSQEIDESSENHTFTWYINDQTREGWNNKKFVWEVDVPRDEVKLRLDIEDKRNGVVYSREMTINIIGIYENPYSWMVLSDDGGESLLSFLSVVKTSIDSGEEEKHPEGSEQVHFTETKFIKNVTGDEPLGSGPTHIMEHYREAIDWHEDVVGNVCIFQESGAVDLEGVGFTKEIDMVDAFDGATFPNGAIYPGTFMEYLDVVTDAKGRLYSRVKLVSTVFNSEYFLQEPVLYEGEVMEQCQLAYGFYSSNRYGLCVMHDGKNDRFLYISDTGKSWNSDLVGVGEIRPIAVSDKVDVTDVIPLDNTSGYELKHMTICAEGDTYAYGYYTIFEEEATGKLFLQKFITDQERGAPREVSYINKREITDLPGKPTAYAFPLYAPQEYAFFAVGKTVYLYDLLNRSSKPEPYYTFESDITALNCHSRRNYHMGVGLENGDFYVLGINKAKNIKEEHKLIYKADQKVGKIVDVQYKNNSMWNY